MKRIFTFLSLAALTTTFASAAQAQYIARKLATNGSPQTAVGISGNRAVGTFGSSGTRNREDAMLWDIRQGTPTFPLSPTNSAFQQISGDWAIRSQFDFGIIQVSSNRSFAATNLVTGQTINLGITASANNSQGYTETATDLRENWAIANVHTRAIARGPYDIYGSKVVNLATGQEYSYSWGTADPFTYINRQIIDVSGARALVNATATGFGFLDLPTGTITNITTGLSSVVGMSGNYIVGARTGTGAVALYDISGNTVRNFGAVGALTNASALVVGANQTIGNAQLGGNNQAVLWDNATGAGTNLHGFLPLGYTSSSAISIDKNFADGPLLVSGTTAQGVTDRYALRGFSGELVEIDTPELASFTGDYTQLGGIVSNGGTIQWINPSGIYNLNGGSLYSTGSIFGGISNGGGILSGGGGSGSGGGIGAFSASGGYGQGSGGTLLLNIGGGTAFDTFTFGGTATLGGALEIALTGGFTPVLGQSFTFFSAPNIVGTWDRIVSPGSLWDVAYSSNSATATYRGTTLGDTGAAAPEPSSLALLTFAIVGFAARRRKIE